MRLTASSTRTRMAMRRIDDDDIDAGIDQPLGALETVVADRGRGSDAQAALLVLAGERMGDRLLDVLDGDQTDAAILIVDDQQLLDAMLMQQALGFVLADAFAHRDELSCVISSEIFWRGSVAKRTSRLVRMPTSLPGLPLPPPVTTGKPEMPCSFISVSASASVASGEMVQRVDHHAGLELLDLPHLRGLPVDIEVAVDNTDAAGLRHGDRHARLGDGIHRGGDDRNVERDFAGQARADIDFGRHDIRQARLQQDVVERVSLANSLKSR